MGLLFAVVFLAALAAYAVGASATILFAPLVFMVVWYVSLRVAD